MTSWLYEEIKRHYPLCLDKEAREYPRSITITYVITHTDISNIKSPDAIWIRGTT